MVIYAHACCFKRNNYGQPIPSALSLKTVAVYLLLLWYIDIPNTNDEITPATEMYIYLKFEQQSDP